MTTRYTFSIHDTNPNIPIIKIDPSIIPTSITSIELPEIPINMQKLQDRLILDVMKDGDASDIHIDDENVYENFRNMAGYNNPLQKNYKTGLKKIEEDIESNIGKGIDFPGLIKAASYQTSGTKGTKIMKTKEILFESGANEQSVCNIIEGYKAERICTPAAALDSASKGAKCVRYFPPQLPPAAEAPAAEAPPAEAPPAEAPPATAAAHADASTQLPTVLPQLPTVLPQLPTAPPTTVLPQPMQVEQSQQSATQIREVVFDSKFCDRFGFPKGFTWSAKNIPNTTNEFYVTFKCDAIYEVSGVVKWGEKFNKAPFNAFGNKEKNKQINKLMKLAAAGQPLLEKDKEKIFQLLLMKELGDVMQVFMFYAYVMIKRYETRPPPSDIGAHLCAPIPIEENAMLTVDSVVYLLCRILGLPCVYTGARAGVQSGQAFYKLFTPIVMKNEDVKQHIIQSLKNMKTIINDNNDENIAQLGQILVGLRDEREKTNNLKWHFFFLKYPPTAAPAATSLAATTPAATATPNAKPKWIEVTMSAFARYTGDLAQYNVDVEIIAKIVKNIEKLINDITENNDDLNKKYEKLLEQYNNSSSSSNLQTVDYTVIQTALDTGSTVWYDWDTNPQPADIPLQRTFIPLQRTFINNKLKEIGNLKQYRSKDYVTKVNQHTYIVNYASSILCDNINTPYKVRSQGYDISKDTIIDITREVEDSLMSIVDAIIYKHKIHSMELNTNAGMIADVDIMDVDAEAKAKAMDAEAKAKAKRQRASQANASKKAVKLNVGNTGLPSEVASTSSDTASPEGTPSPEGTQQTQQTQQTQPEELPTRSHSDLDSVAEDLEGTLYKAIIMDTEHSASDAEHGSASKDSMDTDELSASDDEQGSAAEVARASVTMPAVNISHDVPRYSKPYYKNSDNYLELYNIDENINLLSTFLYNMKTYNVDIEIEFDEETEIEFYKEFDKETETEIPKGEGPIEIRRENAIRAILINAIRGILINEYYLSPKKKNYNKLFKILTMLGDAPISKFIKEPTYPEFNNACTKYKKDEKDDEDTLYININDDTYDWEKSSQSQSSSLTPSPPQPSARRKAEAVTRKKDNRRKKNKQSKKKKRVKNNRSRKITQRNKIKYNNTNAKQRSLRRAKRRASKIQTAKKHKHKQNIVLKNLSN